MFTANFSEQWELLSGIAVADHSTVQDLAARIDVGNYSRLVVIITAEAGSGNAIDVDFEQANALTGGTLKTLNSGGKDVAVADADTYHCIEIRNEEFDVSGGFNYFNVESTPAGARMFSVLVFGLPRFRPASTSVWTTVTD